MHCKDFFLKAYSLISFHETDEGPLILRPFFFLLLNFDTYAFM